MSTYKPLPRSAALTREQVEAFEQLDQLLGSMPAWLDNNNYRDTTFEPVFVGLTSDSRQLPILTQDYQRVYPLTVTIHTSLGQFTPPKWFAVNVDGELLSRSDIMVGQISQPLHYDRPRWMSALLTGIKPVYVDDIVTALHQLMAR